MMSDEDAAAFAELMVIRSWVVAAGQPDTKENFVTMQRDRGDDAQAWVRREFSVFKRARRKETEQ